MHRKATMFFSPWVGGQYDVQFNETRDTFDEERGSVLVLVSLAIIALMY